MSVARLSVERPVLTTMVLAVLVVMGAFSYFKIPLDLFPRVEFPVITILTIFPGASPEEMENLVTDRLEEAVSSIAGIDFMTSNSLEGLSQVIIQFKAEMDQDVAAQDVREKLDLVVADLPDGCERPKILKLDINALPVVEVAVYGDRAVGPLTRFVEDQVKDELTKLDGVADVDVVGGRDREILVLVDEGRLTALGLSLPGVGAVLAQKSVEVPGGRVVRGDREWTVRMKGKFSSVEEIRTLEVPTPGGSIVQLCDFAEVRDAFEEERQRASFNGRPAVLLAVRKRSDANTTKVADAIKARVAELAGRLPADVSVAVVKDRSKFIRDSLDELTGNLSTGVVLTALVLFLFLHSVSTTVIAALAMPASIIGTFLFMFFSGFTINVLTLMAVAITVGILVNNAIVVLENIIRKLHEGMSPREAAVAGTDEVTLPVAAATLTNVVVFVPIAFMGGIVGQFFVSFGLTATYATLVSLIFSFTLTPMLAAWWLKPITPGGGAEGGLLGGFAARFDRWHTGLEREYELDLGRAIRHPLVVLGVCAGLLVLAFSLAPYVGFEFMAQADEGEFMVKLRRPAGSSLESTAEVCRQVEDIVRRQVPELERMTTRVGKIDAVIGASEGVELGQVTVFMTDKNRRARGVEQVIDSLRAELAALTNTSLSLEVPDPIGSAGPPLQVEVLGSDLERLVAFSREVRKLVERTPGAVDVDTTWLAGRPEMEILPDRVRLERAGLSVALLAQSVRGRYAGLTPVTYREGRDEYDVRVQLTRDQRRDAGRVADLQLVTASGDPVSLQHVADVRSAVGPARIVRKDRKRAVVVSGYVTGRAYGDVLGDVQRGVAAMSQAAGIEVRYMGEAKNMRDTFGELAQAFFLATVLTYMLLAALMESFMNPVLILSVLPLAFVGIVPALFVSGMRIGMFALMAVVMLVGIVVNNGILLIENVELRRSRGEDLTTALVKGCPERLRPVLMTTLAAVLAMVPLALGQGAGGEMRAPMAMVSIGGLIASTAFALIVIPLMYHLWERGPGRRFRKTAAAAAAVLVLGWGFGPSALLASAPRDPTTLDPAIMYEALDPGVARLVPQREPFALELEACLRVALDQNRLVRAAQHGLVAANEGVRKARAASYGSLNYGLSWVRYNDDFKTLAGKDQATAKSLSFDLPVWTGGALASGEQSAELGATLARLDQEKARQAVGFSVVEAYFGLIEAQWLQVLGGEHVRQMELQRDLVQARIEAGAAVESERLRVDVALEDARAQLLRFQNARGRAEAGLNLAMGRGIEERTQAVEPRSMQRLAEPLASGFARAQLKRPELLAANAAVRLKREELTRARAAYHPQVGLNVTYGAANALFAGEGDSTQVLFSSTIPLWNGGGRQAEVHRAAAALASERERAEFYGQQVQLEVKQAFLDVTEASDRIEVTRRSLEAAAEHARITAERYRQGAAIVLELVDSELTLLGTRTALLKAVIDYGVALAAYHRSSGDVWRFFGRRQGE